MKKLTAGVMFALASIAMFEVYAETQNTPVMVWSSWNTYHVDISDSSAWMPMIDFMTIE